jgi:putative phosphoesterase
MLRVGLISDTHGLLRPEALAFLEGSDHIVHGGDICDARVLEALAAIAPVTAVRGNNDHGSWASRLRETELFQVGEVFVYAIHDLAHLDIEPRSAGVQVVVSGHSHKPSVERRDGVLYVNPGSAGPRRFKLPISVGELTVTGSSVSARIVELPPPHADARGPGRELE